MSEKLDLRLNLPDRTRSNGTRNKVDEEDRGIHNWYRFVLSYPPHVVRDYLRRFGTRDGGTVLDPFCGTGTTAVEAKILGFRALGVEANAMAHLASTVKTDWRPDPDSMEGWAKEVARIAESRLDGGTRTLLEDEDGLLLANSISARPLHKILVIREAIEETADEAWRDHARLALATTAVKVSNLRFSPEVNARGSKDDAPAIEGWLEEMIRMADDLRAAPRGTIPARIVRGDARHLDAAIRGEKVEAVFTSPPYPNEKDYTRATRLESVILGLIGNKAELRTIKRTLIRSNTKTIYKHDDDATWTTNAKVEAIASEIARRRAGRENASGFEKLYDQVIRLYFGGMARHLAGLRENLVPGAMLGYVVGDQASYYQVHVPTGEILAEIGSELGYEVVGIDLFRTRHATAPGLQMREEVVLLKWPG